MNNKEEGLFPPEKEFDMIVYIGRFQPFHIAHTSTINAAFKRTNRVIVLVGSAENSLSPKNPFNFKQRKQMIEDKFTSGFLSVSGKQLFVEPIKDHTYDDSEWIKEVGDAITKHSFIIDNPKIGIIGHDKDHSSFYLNFFPQWKFIEVPAYPEYGETIDATKIRNLMYSGNFSFVRSVVSQETYRFIDQYTKTSDFRLLQSEWEMVEAYKKSWSNSPWPPTFVTVDSVVVQSGHVLLVQRGQDSGIGLWAIPGGFLDPNESLETANVRELEEETNIKLQRDVLIRSITHSEVFDSPNRSSRGRTITHAKLYQLNDAKPLPKVSPSNESLSVKWVSFSDFAKMESQMYEDHFHIINHMINLI